MSNRIQSLDGLFSVIILAAGQGTRMKSSLPKVLHTVCGKPIVCHVFDATQNLNPSQIILVVGHGSEKVTSSISENFSKTQISFAIQNEQLGTAHAVQCALPLVLSNASWVLVVCGDTPLIESSDLEKLFEVTKTANASVGFISAIFKEPSGYGRVIRDGSGNVLSIREHKDASNEERKICEINSGIYFIRRDFLETHLSNIQSNNSQKEYYLTDLVEIAAKKNSCVTTLANDPLSILGINDRSQLHFVEERMFEIIANRFRKLGVTIRSNVKIEPTVEIDSDVILEQSVILKGNTKIGKGSRIDVGSILTHVHVGENAYIKPYSVCSDSKIGNHAQIGPFSHLRPDSNIGESAHVGNFVETKKTTMHKGSKANHLSYLGDGEIGEEANIGAGTIFCNYDGFRKHKTEIGPRAFIGSDSQLVAPVQVGEGAYVATGTTVTMNVPEHALAIARVRQENKLGYASKLREKLKK